MGRARMPGLDFFMDFLRQERDMLRKFVQDPRWMTDENHENRRGVIEGFTFLMLNLSSKVDQEEAWKLYHEIMDEYHETCDDLRVSY